VQECASKYDYILTLVDSYNHHVSERDALHALNCIGDVLERSIGLIAFLDNVQKNIASFVKKYFDKDKFITIKFDALDQGMVQQRIQALKNTCAQFAATRAGGQPPEEGEGG